MPEKSGEAQMKLSTAIPYLRTFLIGTEVLRKDDGLLQTEERN